MTIQLLAAAAFLAGPPAVGDRAPDFELRDAAGAERSLAEFRGKKAVALVFYPAMFRKGG